MADVGLPHVAIARMIGDAVGLVLQQSRDDDGRRRIAAAARVVAGPAGWTLEPIGGVR